jgi:hypothetical protein
MTTSFQLSSLPQRLIPYFFLSSVKGGSVGILCSFSPYKKGVFDVLGYDAFLKPSDSTPVSQRPLIVP